MARITRRGIPFKCPKCGKVVEAIGERVPHSHGQLIKRWQRTCDDCNVLMKRI